MNQPQQGGTARRFSSDFDCELPPNPRADFYRPRRPQILLPPKPPKKRSWLDSGRSVALFALLIVLALVAVASWSSKSPNYHPPTTTQSTPTPAPASPLAPRAQLVYKPVRRATLYRLPCQEVGAYKWYELPSQWGGGSVWGRYLGTKEHFSEIPLGPVPGDMWNVTSPSASWIYCNPAGYPHPIWIDP
jgi:hypothetical protein